MTAGPTKDMCVYCGALERSSLWEGAKEKTNVVPGHPRRIETTLLVGDPKIDVLEVLNSGIVVILSAEEAVKGEA
jgi:hypothetical protein